ncbi:MAG: hypothetical protein ACKO04_00645 [Actinomycetes bacterium]
MATDDDRPAPGHSPTTNDRGLDDLPDAPTVPDDTGPDLDTGSDGAAEEPPPAPRPVVVVDGLDRAARREVGAGYRARLLEVAAQVLGDRYVVDPADRTQPDVYRDGLVLDAFDVTARCPRRVAGPSDDVYRDSVRNGRRRVALVALRHLAAHGGTPAEAVRQAMADRAEWPVGLARWFEELDRGGRVALAASATTWVVGALRLVGRGPGTRWRPPFPKPAWTLTGRLVRLSAAVDATAGNAESGDRLLVLADRAPAAEDRLRAAFVSLVWTVGKGEAPVRVALGSPATGTMQRLTVDTALLDLALDRTEELLGYLAEPAAAPPVPGRACAVCDLLEDCDAGLRQLSPGPSVDAGGASSAGEPTT